MERPRPQVAVSGQRATPFAAALIPVLFLLVALGYVVIALEGDPRIPIILATGVSALVALWRGHRWLDLQHGMIEGIRVGLLPIVILLLIGAMIGLWIAGGVVPLMIHTGLKVFSPQGFLPAAALLCAIVSVATGSSWTTAGSIGVALIGVGSGLGIDPAMTAGAIVSGAYFGDKMSPLSDSTNLAPAVVGVDLFEHIRHMLYTTVPSFLLALFFFWLLGRGGSVNAGGMEEVLLLLNNLEGQYSLNPVLWLVPLLVILLVVLKVPAIPALFSGCLAGVLAACFVEGHSWIAVLDFAQTGFVSETGLAALDELLSKGGLESMFWTISLILCALAFGGMMERSGQLATLGGVILGFARSRGTLVTSTAATAVATNFMAADQYLAIIFPGRMFKDAYRKFGLARVNLSRVLEDAGTLTSPLVPWNTCGAAMTGFLGVATGDYWIFALFNLINPAVSILYGFTGWTMKRELPEREPEA